MTNSVTQPQTNNTLTTAIAVLGGATAVTLIGGGVGIVGAFGAVGLGAFEIFTGGAVISGAAAHAAQKKLQSKPKATLPRKVSVKPTTGITDKEIENLRRGDF